MGIALIGPLTTNCNWRPLGYRLRDHLTRCAQTAAVPTASVASVSLFLLNFRILGHRAPLVLISHCDRRFIADVVEELLRLSTSHTRHAPYPPHTNELLEHTNQTLLHMISMYVSCNYISWDETPASISYAYNTTKSETTGCSPSYLVYAHPPRTSVDTLFITQRGVGCQNAVPGRRVPQISASPHPGLIVPV